MGNACSVITRWTCSGTLCDPDLRSLDQGFVYDTWARPRAAVADAWVHFTTDPELVERDEAWVDLHSFGGNDARYAYRLRARPCGRPTTACASRRTCTCGSA